MAKFISRVVEKMPEVSMASMAEKAKAEESPPRPATPQDLYNLVNRCKARGMRASFKVR